MIEGLEQDRFAVFTKMHHATIDGAAGAELTRLLFTLGNRIDLDRPPPEFPPAPALPEAQAVFGQAVWDLARRPGRALKFGRKMAGELFRVGRSAEDRRRLAGQIHGVPHTPFNHTITPNRRFTWRSVPLTRVKEIKNALGVTVNDVVMAMSAGALRQYLIDHDALPDEPLVAMIPVSIRTGHEEDPWTNRVSSIFADIPTDEADRAARVAAISAAMADGKAAFDLLPADLLVEAASLAPGRLAMQAARVATNPRVADRAVQPANVVISNVPGPREQLSLGAAPVRHYVPISTVIDGQGLNITVQSYLDTLDIGLVACRELVPDLDHLVELHLTELDALAELAGLD